jgi:hypothetical protein
MKIDLYGKTHSDTAVTIDNLGSLYHLDGQFDKALVRESYFRFLSFSYYCAQGLGKEAIDEAAKAHTVNEGALRVMHPFRKTTEDLLRDMVMKHPT